MTWHSQTAIEGGNMQQAHQQIPIAVLTIGTIVVRVFLSVECKDMTNRMQQCISAGKCLPSCVGPFPDRVKNVFTMLSQHLVEYYGVIRRTRVSNCPVYVQRTCMSTVRQAFCALSPRSTVNINTSLINSSQSVTTTAAKPKFSQTKQTFIRALQAH